MRRLLVVALLLVAPLLVAGTGGATGVDTRAPRPTLEVLRLRPLEIRGVGFRSGQRLNVRLAAESSQVVRHIKATKAGRFTLAFDSVTIDRCEGYVVTAGGRLGPRAVLKAKPLCPPA